MPRAWKQSSLLRNRFPEVALVRHVVEAKAVAGATRAVKDLRCASMNSANLNPFAFSLSALFTPARKVDKICFAQLITIKS